MATTARARPLPEWLASLQARGAGLSDRMRQIFGDRPRVTDARLEQYRTALAAFGELYGAGGEVVLVRSPGRVNLMGVHVEHRGGWVNYMAICRELVIVAQRREDDVVRLANVDAAFVPRSFRIGQELPAAQRGDWSDVLQNSRIVPGDWVNYVKASVLYLQNRLKDRPLRGMDMMVAGDIPRSAGLSSSSALVVGTLEAALWANGLTLTPTEKVQAGGEGEWYVGTRGGAGDHAAMIFGQRDTIAHTRFFPLVVEPVPFPEGYQVLACNSLKEARKAAGARDVFNGRIAAYEIGLMLVRKLFPEHADRLEYLRDLNAAHLGVDQARIYEMLKALPQALSRAEAVDRLPEHAEQLAVLFGTHEPPQDGYPVRDVCLFGLAESDRGEATAELLRDGKIREFGQLMYCSHDGDRVVSWVHGKPRPWDSRATDARLEWLVAESRSGDPGRHHRARLRFQCGGYQCSCPELDQIVDIAKGVPGVAGAGLTGGGLGGVVLALVEERRAEELVDALARGYYGPRGLPPSIEVCVPVQGAGLI